MGFPIRKSTDQRLFAPSRSLSQRTTSFIASYRQGIHQMPLSHLIALISNAHPGRILAGAPERSASSKPALGMDGQCISERPEVNQNKPKPKTLLAQRMGPSTPILQLTLSEMPTSTPAPRLIPSSRCHRKPQPARWRSVRNTALIQHGCYLPAYQRLVEPDGIEPTTSSLQS